MIICGDGLQVTDGVDVERNQPRTVGVAEQSGEGCEQQGNSE